MSDVDWKILHEQMLREAGQAWSRAAELVQERDALRAELAAASMRLEKALNEGASRRTERDALRAELAELRHDICEEREKVERLASSADDANVLINKLFAERNSLHDDVNAFREANAILANASVAATAERDTLRAELAKRDEVMKEAQEKLQPISALVDMTPSGFPDHDICPIRLGMARDLRKLRSRIDAALVNGCSDEKA